MPFYYYIILCLTGYLMGNVSFAKIISKQAKTEFEKVKDNVAPTQQRNLLEESEAIANLRKYHMALQNIKISNDLTEQIRKNYRDMNR